MRKYQLDQQFKKEYSKSKKADEDKKKYRPQIITLEDEKPKQPISRANHSEEKDKRRE